MKFSLFVLFSVWLVELASSCFLFIVWNYIFRNEIPLFLLLLYSRLYCCCCCFFCRLCVVGFNINFMWSRSSFSCRKLFFEQFQAKSCNIRKPRKFCAAKRAFHFLFIVVAVFRRRRHILLLLLKESAFVYEWVELKK